VSCESVYLPHTLCSYQKCVHSRPSVFLPGIYQDFFHSRAGGDHRFFYDLARYTNPASSTIPLQVSEVGSTNIEHLGGILAQPKTVSLHNQFVLVGNKKIHFRYLVVTESLRTFLERIDWPTDALQSRGLGMILEEYVSLLPPVVEFGELGKSRTPMLSISRGYLKFHFFSEDHPKVNVTLTDYIRSPNSASEDILYNLSERGVYAVGPRAAWNTGLSMLSELDRLRDILDETSS
jgi:hypothetical protein